MRHSAASFDISTEGLVALKAAGVPDEVVKVMISRPVGPPTSGSSIEAEAAPSLNVVVSSIDQIQTVVVRAPSDVLRGTAERIITELEGPRINSSDLKYEAALIISVECGDRTWSMLSKSIYVPCTGSLTAQSGTHR